MTKELQAGIARLEEELNRLLSVLDQAQRGEVDVLRHLDRGITSMHCCGAYLTIGLHDAVGQAVRRARLDAIVNAKPPGEK